MIQSNDKQVINPEYTTWLQEEQQAIIILNASLTEEALAMTVGFSSARDIWVALEAAFCNTSVERVQNLRDNLRALKKGDKSVADFGREFKSICDQLHAVGHPVDSMDQLHWLVPMWTCADSHELFVKNLSSDGTPPIVAFSAQTDKNAQQAQRSSFSNRSRQSHKNSFFEQAQPFSGRSNRPNRGAFSQTFGRGPGQSPRSFFGQPRGLTRGQFQSAFGPPFYPISSPPICQLCGKTGHLASQCWHLASFSASASPSDEQMAQAFHAHCNLSPSVPDWTSDTGASTHMLPNTTPLQNSSPVSGSSNEANNSAGMP